MLHLAGEQQQAVEESDQKEADLTRWLLTAVLKSEVASERMADFVNSGWEIRMRFPRISQLRQSCATKVTPNNSF